MALKSGDTVYFMGIGGTGMASVAGLAQEAGFNVLGSDINLYPPMSTMLEELKIKVLSPYAPTNVVNSGAQLVVVGNALSRGHLELEAMLEKGTPFTSFPAFLGDHFLDQRTTVVVAGTHGKTTTSSILACIAKNIGWDPGYLIGGIPRDLPRSFALGNGKIFVIEGDEYDTSFFDKNSKFLHYRPKYIILNNIEFDHADIFKDLAAVELQFANLLKLVADPKHIIANIDDPGVTKLLQQLELLDKITSVSSQGLHLEAEVRLLKLIPPQNAQSNFWTIRLQMKDGQAREVQTILAGPHNAANICQVLTLLELMQDRGDAPRVEFSAIAKALKQFGGVKRRLDHLATAGNIDIFEDFAHHPTAVKAVIESMRTLYPERRLLVAFEPKNATSRRNVFLKDFAKSLGLADQVFIGPCPVDQRIPVAQRMDTQEMADLIGVSAQAFTSNELLLDSLVQHAKPNDAIVFMSSSSFSGIQYRLGERLAAPKD